MESIQVVPEDVHLQGFGVKIKDHTKKNDKHMPKGVQEDLYLTNFSIQYPDVQEELRHGVHTNIFLQGLPLEVQQSLKTVAGVGSEKKVDITVVAYQETTNATDGLKPAKKAELPVFVRTVRDGCIEAVLADKGKVDTFNSDGKTLFSMNLNPKDATVTK